jgi:hypothetical protein
VRLLSKNVDEPTGYGVVMTCSLEAMLRFKRGPPPEQTDSVVGKLINGATNRGKGTLLRVGGLGLLSIKDRVE